MDFETGACAQPYSHFRRHLMRSTERGGRSRVPQTPRFFHKCPITAVCLISSSIGCTVHENSEQRIRPQQVLVFENHIKNQYGLREGRCKGGGGVARVALPLLTVIYPRCRLLTGDFLSGETPPTCFLLHAHKSVGVMKRTKQGGHVQPHAIIDRLLGRS